MPNQTDNNKQEVLQLANLAYFCFNTALVFMIVTVAIISVVTKSGTIAAVVICGMSFAILLLLAGACKLNSVILANRCTCACDNKDKEGL
jgi:hypothetical protein